MKSMLILTDFSEAAFRAAEFGCELADCLHIKKIVLLHTYQPVMAYATTPDAVVPAGDDHETQHLEHLEKLGMLHDRLKPRVSKDVIIDMVDEDTALAKESELVNEQCKKEGVGLIVMGVSGQSGLDKFLMGSMTTTILKNVECPTLIVPEDTKLGNGIRSIVFTTDLHEVDTIPYEQLREFLDAFPGDLRVVNVHPESKDKLSGEKQKAIADIHQSLAQYNPAFNYIAGDDIVKEVLNFSKELPASLIIAVHHKRGFLSSLFNKSVTKKLAYKTSIPLLSLPAVKK